MGEPYIPPADHDRARALEFRSFLSERVGKLVFVEISGTRGKTNLVGEVLDVGAETARIRTDKPPIREHLVSLAGILRATEKMPHDPQGNPTSRART